MVLTLPPLKCRTSMHNLHHSKSKSAQRHCTLSNKYTLKNQLEKMHARGKTCFLQQQQLLLHQNSKKVHQKKATGKMEVLKNQLKKCKLEVRRVFQTKQEMASDSKVRKSPPKTDMRQKQLCQYLLDCDWLTA